MPPNIDRFFFSKCMCVCVCVCVYIYREREIDETKRIKKLNFSSLFWIIK